jgi:catechol 2,3-dioxygenase-like lactoylglutathione lyase family enzyme
MDSGFAHVGLVVNDYQPGYYAVFFYDPDGIKLELRHVPER